MATVFPWKVGAFQRAFPNVARQIGNQHALEGAACEVMFATAGACSEGQIDRETYPVTGDVYPPGYCTSSTVPVRGCCGAAPCAPGENACARGTCSCDEGEDSFAETFPDAKAALDNAHALAAAMRDILADPDVEDVAGAQAVAMRLAKAGTLAALYVPASPAKPLPDGSPAPARCPICGAVVCPSCGCSCSCVSGAVDDAEDAAEPPEGAAA